MDRVARLPAKQRSELFSETATQKSAAPAVVKKDFVGDLGTEQALPGASSRAVTIEWMMQPIDMR